MASWQVDIPGFSQLVLNAGANGLKQLALSGVDIHTIGCMLMVSELIPVSQDFRHALNNSREKQRAERQWLYKVVEIGTGSFFLVDQFLKTRAGENVLALMASIVPLMSQDACVAVLGILFETAGASNDCTPGVSQLSRLREGLLLYVRNVGFQERVLQYHAILDRISTAGSSTTKAHGRGDPFDAIPAKHNIARIIQLCHKVATSTDNCVLTFSGLNGSGWLGAYATLILGLPVCALDSKGNHVPLNCSYGQAKVILNPSEESGSCKLLISGQLGDFISIDSMDASSRRGWTIDCKTVNFLRLNHPEIENSQVHAVSEFAAVVTLNLVAHMVRRDKEHWHYDPVIPYFVAILPQIQRRSLEVLTLLGFRVKDLEYYRSSHNCRSGGTYEDTQAKIAAFDFSGVSCPQCLDAAEYSGFAAETLFGETLNRATCFASGLAFTDWSTKLQTISAQYAYGRLDLQMKPASDARDLCQSIDPIVGLGQALSACTDLTDRKLLPPGDWLVVDLDGVVVLRTLATCQSIHMADGKFLSLLPGHITFEEQKRSIVRMDDDCDFDSESVKSTSPLSEPLNIVPLLQSRMLFSCFKDTVWARQEIFNGNDFLTVARPIDIAIEIQYLYVTRPCSHPYQTPSKAPYSLFDRHSRIGFDTGRHGLADFFGPSSYQHTDCNDLGQWLACQYVSGKTGKIAKMKILQLDTCIDCTVDMLNSERNIPYHSKCIIAGRKQELGEKD